MSYKNKEVKKINDKKWYDKNKERICAHKRIYYQKNKDRISKRMKKYWAENKDRLSRYSKFLPSWEGYIPKRTRCQICNREIFFNNKDGKNAIHFDHKKENLPITICPTEWLARNFNTPANQKTWEQCDFGILCGTCNRSMPTKNRKGRLVKITEYVSRKENR